MIFILQQRTKVAFRGVHDYYYKGLEKNGLGVLLMIMKAMYWKVRIMKN